MEIVRFSDKFFGARWQRRQEEAFVPTGLCDAQCQCEQQEERWLHHHFEHGIHADFQVHGNFAEGEHTEAMP